MNASRVQPGFDPGCKSRSSGPCEKGVIDLIGTLRPVPRVSVYHCLLAMLDLCLHLPTFTGSGATHERHTDRA